MCDRGVPKGGKGYREGNRKMFLSFGIGSTKIRHYTRRESEERQARIETKENRCVPPKATEVPRSRNEVEIRSKKASRGVLGATRDGQGNRE